MARKLSVLTRLGFASAALALLVAQNARAADDAKLSPADTKAYQEAVQKGIDYLTTKGQAEDGSFSAAVGPGVTAIVVTSMLENGRTATDPSVAKGLKYLEGFVQSDGGVYGPKSRILNYETCLAMVCFKAANKDKKYDRILANGEKFLKGLQFTEGDGRTPADVSYGGVGYGGAGRPDLSNTHFLTDALEATGATADDEAVKKALIFISRCQNLESAHNTEAFAAKNPDGGFIYTPSGGGQSPAGKTEKGGLRSYGSMSYAALKSMIFAGLKADDPRVKAAVAWAKAHYSLAENPGLGDEGLFYYYHLFAKALNALGEPSLTDNAGKTHNWRAEMIEELAKRQQPDGSWVNKNSKWMEGDPNLVTGYALLTLSYCKPTAK